MIPTGALTCLLTAIKEAGLAILALQHTDYQVSKKANNDIVTQADYVANDILKKYLLGSFPHYGWLSEENVDDAKRLQCDYIWIVDPIDGTKEYAAGMDEYAVSVALVKDGAPIIAAVYNPATDELFYAVKDQGAWLNHHLLDCRVGSDNPCTTDDLVVLASRSEYHRGEWDPYLALFHVKPIGSIAYKLALVGAGLAHATFSIGPKHEWDIAGGVLIVQEAKGQISNLHKQPFLFNQRDVLVNGIIAALPQYYDNICLTIDRISHER